MRFVPVPLRNQGARRETSNLADDSPLKRQSARIASNPPDESLAVFPVQVARVLPRVCSRFRDRGGLHVRDVAQPKPVRWDVTPRQSVGFDGRAGAPIQYPQQQ